MECPKCKNSLFQSNLYDNEDAAKPEDTKIRIHFECKNHNCELFDKDLTACYEFDRIEADGETIHINPYFYNKLNTHQISEINKLLADWLKISIPRDELIKIIESDRDFFNDISDVYIPRDNNIKELIVNQVARYLTDQDFDDKYCDPDKEDLEDLIREKVVEKGWKVLN